jgi:hypothetical protein
VEQLRRLTKLTIGFMMFVLFAGTCQGGELPAALAGVMGNAHVAVLREAETHQIRGEFNSGIIADFLAVSVGSQLTARAGGEHVALQLTDGVGGIALSAKTTGTASLSGAPRVIGTIQANVSDRLAAGVAATGSISSIKATILPGQFSVDFR